MRVLICGGRKFQDYALFELTMKEFKREFPDITCVIHGGAQGADTLGAQWALQNKIPVEKYEVTSADWKKYGFAAGPLRNQRMIDEGMPDYVIAFPGNAGTADMIDRAKRAGIPVKEIPAM